MFGFTVPAIVWKLGVYALVAGVIFLMGYEHGREPQLKIIASMVQASKDAEKAANERITKATKDANDQHTDIEHMLKDQLAAGQLSYQSALDELRKRDANRPAPLKAAAAAPVECRDYSADITRLPLHQQESIIWLGSEANRLAEVVHALRAEVKLRDDVLNEIF